MGEHYIGVILMKTRKKTHPIKALLVEIVICISITNTIIINIVIRANTVYFIMELTLKYENLKKLVICLFFYVLDRTFAISFTFLIYENTPLMYEFQEHDFDFLKLLQPPVVSDEGAIRLKTLVFMSPNFTNCSTICCLLNVWFEISLRKHTYSNI